MNEGTSTRDMHMHVDLLSTEYVNKKIPESAETNGDRL